MGGIGAPVELGVGWATTEPVAVVVAVAAVTPFALALGSATSTGASERVSGRIPGPLQAARMKPRRAERSERIVPT
jgi:hypothetical protein